MNASGCSTASPIISSLFRFSSYPATAPTPLVLVNATPPVVAVVPTPLAAAMAVTVAPATAAAPSAVVLAALAPYPQMGQ